MIKYAKIVVGPIAFWSGLWLLVVGALELAQKGYVVHHVNTRWVWMIFGVSALVWLITKE